MQQAGVNFAAEEAQIVFDSTQVSETQIIEIIHKTGFSAHIKQANELPIEEKKYVTSLAINRTLDNQYSISDWYAWHDEWLI